MTINASPCIKKRNEKCIQRERGWRFIRNFNKITPMKYITSHLHDSVRNRGKYYCLGPAYSVLFYYRCVNRARVKSKRILKRSWFY